MRAARHAVLFLGALAIASGVTSPALGSDKLPVVTAKAAILIDAQTGEVLWQRNPDLPLPPASTTKIVTALLALQSGRLSESFSVSAEAAQAPPSKISLRPGWRMELRDLVYALLLNSANDASIVIAEGLAGTIPSFANRMNAQARQLGASNTHFANPNGLPDENHFSTARDLATMFSHALQNPEFERIVSTKTTIIAPPIGSRRAIRLRNHNRLLDDYHIHVVGKTGFTRAAKRCFVGAGTDDGREVLVAVLGSNNLWGDVKTLLEYGLGEGPMPVALPENVPMLVSAPPTERTGRSAASVRRVVPTTDRRYVVRLATFESNARAKRLQESMIQKGYSARIVRVRQKQRVMYRVLVGSYTDRRQAQQVADRIARLQPSLKVSVDALS
jgi:serine-type D-Ala-D-Ala carboxypeptidase (penicillin-binding protein 5/6)